MPWAFSPDANTFGSLMNASTPMQCPLIFARVQVLGLECCDLIGSSIGDHAVYGNAVRDPDISCQEHVEGDCMPAFGIDADGAVTQCALELVDCTGDGPSTPTTDRTQ